MNMRSILTSLGICLLLASISGIKAQTIEFNLEGQAGAGLLTGNEVNGASGSGSGGVLSGIVFDVSTNVLSIDVGWGSGNGFSDLTGDATMMHIHGPADIFTNTGVLYNLGGLSGFNPSATSGGLNDSLTIDSGDVPDLLAGNFYLNVHTATNGGGEIRANLIQAIPEPTSLAIVGLLGCAGFLQRRRR